MLFKRLVFVFLLYSDVQGLLHQRFFPCASKLNTNSCRPSKTSLLRHYNSFTETIAEAVEETVDELLENVDDFIHKPLASAYHKYLKDLFSKEKKSILLLPQLKQVFKVMDVTVVVLAILMHKKALRLIYRLINIRKFDEMEYRKSFLGYIEPAVTLSTAFFPFLYLIDLLSILMHFLGFRFHLKVCY